jgi:hypothetical protein
MRALGSVQLDWGNPNCGRHTVSPYDLMERRLGLRAPSVGKPIGQGKAMGASPTHDGVARPKVAVVVMVQGQGPGGGGDGHHIDRDGGGMDRRRCEAVTGQDR